MINPHHIVGSGGVHMEDELYSQPSTWARAADQASTENVLPAPGQRVAVVGCGTSWFMGQSYANLRERGGFGLTDAYAASEAFVDRDYDAIIALSRSGTTTEVLQLLEDYSGPARTIGIVGDVSSPLVDAVDNLIALPYADELSVVQTRFATTALVYLRSSLGESLRSVIVDAEHALAEETDIELITAQQYTFLGRGWTIGLAHEAALKLREASQSWTESYPAMDYRHGPIAIAAPGRVSWVFGAVPEGLEASISAAGARYVNFAEDPLASLVRTHKLALELARSFNLDPDLPRNLTRSVVLS